MANLEFIPVDQLTEPEIELVGSQLYDLLKRGMEKVLKEEFYLPGVVERHGTSRERSVAQVIRARDRGVEQGLSAFVINAGTRGNLVTAGMASVQEGLPLYRQRLEGLPIPARYTRNRVLGKRIETPPANVAAWTEYTRPGTNGLKDDIAEAYSFLRERAPQSWTLSPEAANIPADAHQDGLHDAGYHPAHGMFRRYDDMEAGGVPPLSALYVSEY